MLKFHLPYNGPPEKCQVRDYWCIFLLAILAAGVEFWLATEHAKSSAALADAIHAFVHSILYAITAFTGWLFQRRNYLPERRQKKSVLLGVVVYTPIILLGLGYVVIYEAWPRLFRPEPVVTEFMFISALIGLIANLLAWLGLQEIKTRHGAEDARHSLLSLDALEDILISLAVLTGAVSIKTTGIYRIDAIITIGAALWITWQVYKILQKEIKTLI